MVEKFQGIWIHDASMCEGNHCPFHNPSQHHMVAWPMHVRMDDFKFSLVERLCGHGIGHPDPDSLEHLGEGFGLHGCDGCCSMDFEPAIQEVLA